LIAVIFLELYLAFLWKNKRYVGKLNLEEIEQLLKQQLIGRIGCHADGLTYVVPVSYAYDGDYIYSRTFEGMKINMMRRNPDVCFEVEDTKSLSKWRSVVAWGSFEELQEGLERKEAVRVLKGRKLPAMSSETMKLGSIWPFSSVDENIDGVIFRIRLKEKTGRYEESLNEPYFAT
jgi:nitroimidazol reductase NimA-like FMN-containing flavoprotein (pyridoxamine 5'-phosphate oxidase superfamily)